MSKEQTLPPLLSDEQVWKMTKQWLDDFNIPSIYPAIEVLDIYEADRQKTREVVQALVDALAENSGRGNTPISSVMKADYAMNLAKSINIEPTK